MPRGRRWCGFEWMAFVAYRMAQDGTARSGSAFDEVTAGGPQEGSGFERKASLACYIPIYGTS
jgi:hypothetical protein